MNNYGKALAHTGAVGILGMSAGWAIAAAAGSVLIGIAAIRFGYRRNQGVGQR